MFRNFWSPPVSLADRSIFRDYNAAMDTLYKIQPHNPPHYFVSNAMYMVTGSILYNQRLLFDNARKSIVCELLFERAKYWGWDLEAWAVLENHYHFVARAPENALTLERLIRGLHSKSAIELNKLDKTPGRQIWHNYWDTCITHESSYHARLHYVHLNPVKHRLVERAEDYPFCSYSWFLEKGDGAFRETVMSQPIDRVEVMDEFDS